jgi:hypothetical protein
MFCDRLFVAADRVTATALALLAGQPPIGLGVLPAAKSRAGGKSATKG